jgi:predicted secreted protein
VGDLPALDFANAAQTQSLDSRDALDTYRTVVIATDMQSTASGADELFGQQGADFGIRHYNGSAYPQGTLADPNSADWASGTGATPQEWTDGTQATEPTIGTPQIITDVSAQPQTIAAAIGDYALSRGLVGTIGEIVAFKGTLSTAARDAVQAYLAQKWGASDSANAAFAPVIVTQPTATTVTAGQTATLTAGAAAIPAASVQWQTTTNGGTTWVSDTTDGGATTGTLTVADASVALSGAQYRAVFNNSQGTATSSPAVLTVVGPPSVTTQPAAETINVGQTATFQAAVSANPAATSTQWQVSTDGGSTWHDDTTDAGATTDTLTVAGATAAENGYEYRLAITNTIGETITNPVRLTVRYAPVITTQPVAATIALGQTATFTIAVSGSPTPSIQWRISFNSGQSYNTLPGANAPSFSVTNAVAGQNGALLDAVVSNSLGTVTSAPALLTIANPPGNTAPPTISGTPQDGLVLTRSGRGTWTSGSALTYADQWERCDSAGTQCTAIAGATGVVYRAKSADVGHELTVAVTATDRLGQSATATATPTAVVADPPPPVNTGRPSVSGTPQEGLVLTRASTGTWSSVDTLSFTDQWERCDPNGLECAPIAGATGIVYRARSADVGSTIALAVTATDKEGQKMTATSAPTAAVSAS